MPSLQEILQDPNYVNANEATKQAIFTKYSAQDENFTSANEATQEAIRQKFGAAPPQIAPTIDVLGHQFTPEEYQQAAQASNKVREEGVNDVSLSALQGVLGAKEALVGIASIPTLGLLGKTEEAIEKGVFGGTSTDARNALQKLKSTELQSQEKKVSQIFNDEGFIAGFKEAVTSPRVLVGTVVESLPSMFAGAGIGRTLYKAGSKALGAEMVGAELPGYLTRKFGDKIAPILAGALGEGAISGGSNAESTRQQNESGFLTPQQSALATLSGLFTSFFGLLGGKIANKLNIGDMDTMLIKGTNKISQESVTKAQKSIIRKALEGAFVESTLEELPQSLQEQALQNIAQGKDFRDGLAEAGTMGFLTGGILGGGAAAISSNKQPQTITDLHDVITQIHKKQIQQLNQPKNDVDEADLIVHTTTRLNELNQKVKDNTATDQEKAEHDFIAQNINNPIALAQAYNVNLKTKGAIDETKEFDTEDLGIEEPETEVKATTPSTNQQVKKINDEADEDADPVKVIKQPSPPKSSFTAPTLLGALKRLGGVTMKDKSDVSGERKGFAPGGYNAIFTNKTEKGLMNHIESGSLDRFLPPDIRLQGGIHEATGQAYDPGPAYEFLATKIRNGEKVLSFEVQEEINDNQQYQEDNATLSTDIDEISQLEEEFINEQLRIAINEDKQTTEETKQPVSKVENRAPISSAPAEALTLEGQTNEEIAQQEAAKKAAEDLQTQEQAKLTEAERQAKINEEIKQRSEGAADTFELGQTADQNLTGQGEIFGEGVNAGQIKTLARKLLKDGALTEAQVAKYDQALSDPAANPQTVMDDLTNDVQINEQDVRDLGPMYEKIKAKPGANVGRIAAMLGPQLYGSLKNIQEVSVKEMVQNSFDAIKTMIEKGIIDRGNISINVNVNDRSITIKDNGSGMSPDILQNTFFTIAGTNKETEFGSGAFGIAKMLFLYNNQNVEVTTMRDGTISHFVASGEQLKASLDDPSQAPEFDTYDANQYNKTELREDFPQGHGTIITVVVPKTYTDPSTGKTEDIPFIEEQYEFPVLMYSPLFRNIEVRFNGENIYIGSSFPKEDYTTFVNADFDWGTARIYVSTKKRDEYGKNVHILSNGLWQFSEKLTKKPGDRYADNIPYRFFIDIVSKAKPEEQGYPFTFNRQNLTKEANADLELIKNYLWLTYTKKDLVNTSTSFGNVHYLSKKKGIIKVSAKEDLNPEIKVQETPDGIKEGSNVKVVDGQLIVNGKPIPALSTQDLKNATIDLDELKIPQDEINSDDIMVHDNLNIEYKGNFKPITELAKEKFGERFDSFMYEIGDVFKTLRDRVVYLNIKGELPNYDDIGYKDLANHAIGISFDKEYRGVSIKLPFDGMFINPALPEFKDPERAGFGLFGTMIHELAHYQVRNHEEEFPAEMQRLSVVLKGDKGFDLNGLEQELVKSVIKNKDILDYLNDLGVNYETEAIGQRFKDSEYERATRRTSQNISEPGGAGQLGRKVPSNIKSRDQVARQMQQSQSVPPTNQKAQTNIEGQLPPITLTTNQLLRRIARDNFAFEEEIEKKPSLRIELKRLQKALQESVISYEEYANDITSLLEATKKEPDTKERVRGAEHIKSKLLVAMRKKELSPEAVKLAIFFIDKNPALFKGLGISIKAKTGEDVVSGFYEPTNRIANIMKYSTQDLTTIHEFLHDMERMLPKDIQSEIRKAWINSLVKAAKAAQKDGDLVLNKYYENLLDHHTTGNIDAKDVVRRMIADKEIKSEHYAHYNPSEFWAVNASKLIQNRFNSQQSIINRLKQWLKEFIQVAKGAIGLDSQAPLIKALGSLAKSDGEFKTSEMIYEDQNVTEVIKANPKEYLNIERKAPREFQSSDIPEGAQTHTIPAGTEIYHGAHGDRATEIEQSGSILKARPQVKSGAGMLYEGELVWFGDKNLAKRHSASEVDTMAAAFDKQEGKTRKPGKVFGFITDKPLRLRNKKANFTQEEADALNKLFGLKYEGDIVKAGDDLGNLGWRAHNKAPKHQVGQETMSSVLSVALNNLGYDGYFDQSGIALNIGDVKTKVLDNVEKLDESTTDTPAFKKWFGKSKIVNADGKPKVMYHGTAGSSFTVFDKEKIKTSDYDTPFNGFWFSSDPRTSPAMRDAKNVIPVYLSIKNPAPSEVWRKVSKEVYSTLNPSDIRKNARSVDDEVRYRLQDMGYDGIQYNGKPTINKQEFEKNGQTSFKSISGYSYTIAKNNKTGYVDLYDGKVIGKPSLEKDEFITDYSNLDDFLNSEKEETWVAFEPNQIKSATGNRGTYDSTSNILYNIEEPDESDRLESVFQAFNVPETTPHDPKTTKEMVDDSVEGIKKAITNYKQDPKAARIKMIGAMDTAITKFQNGYLFFGSALEKTEARLNQGSLRLANNTAVASAFLTQAIHAGHMASQVMMRGKLVFNEAAQWFEAADSEFSMKNVMTIEHNLYKKVGKKVAAKLINTYFEAKRARSIQNEFLEREAERQRSIDANEDPEVTQRNYEAIKKAYDKIPDYLRQHGADGKTLYQEIRDTQGKVIERIPILSDEAIDTFIDQDNQHPELRDMMDNWTPVNHNMLDMMVFGGVISRARADKLKAIKDYVPWFRIQDDSEELHAPSGAVAALTNVSKERKFKKGETAKQIDNIVDNMINNILMMTRNSVRNYAMLQVTKNFATRKENGRIAVFPSEGFSPDGAVRTNVVANGRRIIIEFKDPLIADSVLGLPNLDIPMIGVFSAFQQFGRRSITLNPVFQAWQVIKDAPTAAAVTGLKNPYKAVGQILLSFFKALLPNDPIVKILKSRGVGGFQFAGRTAEKEVKLEMGVLSHKIWPSILKVLDHIGDASDYAQRRIIYQEVLKDTGDELQATWAANNVIDFMRRGNSRLALAEVRSVAFMGAYANQLDVLMTAIAGGGFRGPSRLKAMAKFAAITAAFSAAVIVYCMLKGDDDDYKDLDDQTKLRHWIIGGTKIPMSTSYSFFYKSIVESSFNYIVSQGTKSEVDDARYRRMLKRAALDSLLGPNPIPNLLKSPVEIITNHNFFTGGTVTPRNLENLDTFMQYTRNTSELGKWISHISLGALSPIESDHLVRGWSGTIGALTMWGSDLFTNDKPEKVWAQNPVIGQLFLQPEAHGREDLFYDLKQESDKYFNTWTKLRERRRVAEAKEYFKEHKPYIIIHDNITGADQALKSINAEMRRISDLPAAKMSSDVKLKRLTKFQHEKNNILKNITILRAKAGR